jgi:hypothetical protein
MTTIVTRLYPDAKTADDAVGTLKKLGLTDRHIDVVGAGADAADKLKAARVAPASAAAYAAHLEGDRKVVIARAPFTPIGIALKTIKAMNRFASIDAGIGNENVYLREVADPSLFNSVDGNHGHIFSNFEPGYSSKIGFISERWGFAMLAKRMNTGSPTIISKPREKSVYPGGKHFTGTLDTLIRRGLVAGGDVREGRIMGGKITHSKPLSEALNWKTIAPRREG